MTVKLNASKRALLRQIYHKYSGKEVAKRLGVTYETARKYARSMGLYKFSGLKKHPLTDLKQEKGIEGCGVFAIVNGLSGAFYLDYSSSIYGALQSFVSQLNKGNCNNKFLLEDWQKDKSEFFVVILKNTTDRGWLQKFRSGLPRHLMYNDVKRPERQKVDNSINRKFGTKIQPEQVAEIVELRDKGWKLSSIAKKYQVHTTYIHFLLNGKIRSLRRFLPAHIKEQLKDEEAL